MSKSPVNPPLDAFVLEPLHINSLTLVDKMEIKSPALSTSSESNFRDKSTEVSVASDQEQELLTEQNKNENLTLSQDNSSNTSLSKSEEVCEVSSPSGSASGLMMKLFVSGAPRNKSDQKKTVLPTSLLQGVTELVKSRGLDLECKEKFELDNVDHTIQSSNSLPVDITQTKKDTQSLHSMAKEDDEVDSLISNTCNFITDTEQGFKGGDLSDVDKKIVEPSLFFAEEHNKLISADLVDTLKNITCSIASKSLEDNFLEVLNELPGESVLGTTPVKPADHVYNLSDLFSGELEKRRKRELKKWKRNLKKQERFGNKKPRSCDKADGDKSAKGEETVSRKPVPNYFVAIQIIDQQIKEALQKVQDKVVSGNKHLKAALNKVSTLHLTMCVLSLNSEEDMHKSKLALDKASGKLLASYEDRSLALDISGLGHFRNEVVFAKVKTEDQVSSLKQIADTVEDCLLDVDIVSPDKRGFKPHVTIMKLSKVRKSKKKGTKKISEELYSDFVDTDFGSEMVSTLQLCSMMKPKDKHGYYQVEHAVQFAKCISDTDLLDSKSEVMGETSEANSVDTSRDVTVNTSTAEPADMVDTSIDVIVDNNKADEEDTSIDVTVDNGKADEEDTSRDVTVKTSTAEPADMVDTSIDVTVDNNKADVVDTSIDVIVDNSTTDVVDTCRDLSVDTSKTGHGNPSRAPSDSNIATVIEERESLDQGRHRTTVKEQNLSSESGKQGSSDERLVGNSTGASSEKLVVKLPGDNADTLI